MVSLRSLFGRPSPADRVRRARRFMQLGEPNEARMELEGVDDPEARALLDEACRWLVRLNIEEALLRKANGEHQAAREAVARMRTFHATPEELAIVGRVRLGESEHEPER